MNRVLYQLSYAAMLDAARAVGSNSMRIIAEKARFVKYYFLFCFNFSVLLPFFGFSVCCTGLLSETKALQGQGRTRFARSDQSTAA